MPRYEGWIESDDMSTRTITVDAPTVRAAWQLVKSSTMSTEFVRGVVPVDEVDDSETPREEA